MSDGFNIDGKVELDDSAALSKFENLSRKADDIAAKEQKLRAGVAKTARKAAGLAIAVVGFLQNVFTIVGIQLDALQQAVLISIQQVISTAVAWFTLQAAITTATFGVAAIGLVAAAAALGVAVGNAALIAIHGERVNTKMSAILGAINNLSTIAQTFAE